MEGLHTEGLGIKNRLTRVAPIHLEFCSCLFLLTWTDLVFCFWIIFPLKLLTSGLVLMILLLLFFTSPEHTVYLAWFSPLSLDLDSSCSSALLPDQSILASIYPLNSGLNSLWQLQPSIPRVYHPAEENYKWVTFSKTYVCVAILFWLYSLRIIIQEFFCIQKLGKHPHK